MSFADLRAIAIPAGWLITLGAASPLPPPPALQGARSLAVDPDFAEVAAMEMQLWEAWRVHDRATIVALSDPDYVNVEEESIATLPEILAEFDNVTVDSYALGAFAPLRVSADVIVLNYRAEIRGHYDGPHGRADLSRPVSESSLWVRREGRWRNLMLRETSVAAARYPHPPPLNER